MTDVESWPLTPSSPLHTAYFADEAQRPRSMPQYHVKFPRAARSVRHNALGTGTRSCCLRFRGKTQSGSWLGDGLAGIIIGGDGVIGRATYPFAETILDRVELGGAGIRAVLHPAPDKEEGTGMGLT